MPDEPSFKARFCSQCGAPLQARWVEADQRERLACTRCGSIHYQNPKVLVVAKITNAQRVLLCRRARTRAGFVDG